MANKGGFGDNPQNINRKGRPKGSDYSRAAQTLGFNIEEWKTLTECEVRERFRIWNAYFDVWEVVRSQEGFPDLILRRNGELYRCEVETQSLNFKLHKHDPNGCDFILAWVDNWRGSPLPVIALAPLWETFKTIWGIEPYARNDRIGDIIEVYKGVHKETDKAIAS